jgi:AcrR family transcriptional regulator
MTDRRRARSAHTEEVVVAAATRLFVERGYARTSIADVAEAAGVSERTVYVRFAGKAELLKRAIDVAAAGDTEGVPVSARAWMTEALSAPTLDDRIDLLSAGIAEMHARLVPLVGVALEVVSEQVIAESARGGRTGTRNSMTRFWKSAERDGLLEDGVDVAWLAETATIVAAAETALLRRHVVGDRGYAAWLARTLRQLARPEGGPRPAASRGPRRS